MAKTLMRGDKVSWGSSAGQGRQGREGADDADSDQDPQGRDV
jgi:hypothetical protein